MRILLDTNVLIAALVDGGLLRVARRVSAQLRVTVDNPLRWLEEMTEE